jgi:hypothetical protein
MLPLLGLSDSRKSAISARSSRTIAITSILLLPPLAPTQEVTGRELVPVNGSDVRPESRSG